MRAASLIGSPLKSPGSSPGTRSGWSSWYRPDQSPTKLTCANAGVAASADIHATTKTKRLMRIIVCTRFLSTLAPSHLLQHLRLGRRALQMLIEIRQARHFLNVLVDHTVEALCALPLAFPVLRVGHRVFDLELVAHHAEALDDVQLLTSG